MPRAQGSLAKVPVYLGAAGCGANSFRNALHLAAEFAGRGGYAHMTLIVPTLGHTQGDFDDVLGEAAASKLRRNYRLTAGKLTIHLATRRRRLRFAGPVVAAWSRPAQIRELLQDDRCATLIVVPWTEADMRDVLKFAPTATRF